MRRKRHLRPAKHLHHNIRMSTYSFLAGVLTGILATALAGWLWRLHGQRLQRTSLRQLALVGAAALGTFAIAALVIYLTVARSPTGPVAQVSPTAPHPGATPGEKAQSMEEATAGLAARLAREGGTPEQWELLARSYEFLGRPEDAQKAREHEAQAGAAPAPSMEAAMQEIAAASEPSGQSAGQGASSAGAGSEDDSALEARIDARLKSHPKDVDALLALAELDSRQRRYAAARATYVKVIALKGMNADAWADYADVLAALAGGSLGGEAGRAIERSLALDPTNEKGLWLKASRAFQERRYADALALWKTLRASLPAGSPDVQLVDDNITEATRLAGGGSPAASTAAAAPVAITGTVSIDRELAKAVDPQATLFIYAKAVDSPGPPLAVMRTAASAWPVKFRLDDSMAMIPSRRLSQFDQVVVEARVSRTGQAIPAPGDLYVTSPVLKPGDGKPVTLVISHRIS